MLIRPSRLVHAELLRAFEDRMNSYDDGDQGLLQTFFQNRSVTRIPDQYNTLRRREKSSNMTNVVGFHLVGAKKLAGYAKFTSVHKAQASACSCPRSKG